jgi:hypothetical protein
MAACGASPIPNTLEYWRRQLATVAGRISKAQVEEALAMLEDAGLITSTLDALGMRQYWITAAGMRVSAFTPKE